MSSLSFEKLQILADDLTKVSPPPNRPTGLNYIVEGTGKWVVVKVGSGMYAIRPEYEDSRGGKVVATQNGEIRGFAPAIETALRFAISIANSHRHYWTPAAYVDPA